MKDAVYQNFLKSGDALRVYHEDNLLFSSSEDGVAPLLGYIQKYLPLQKRVVVLDKVAGNAAALLSIKALAIEVWAPLGSRGAIETLNRYHIPYHLDEIVSHICNSTGSEICPLEKLSLSEGMDPENFYQVILLRQH